MSRSPTRRQFLAGTGAACAAAVGGSGLATASETASDRSPGPDDLEAFVDDLIESALVMHDVPGATVAVVRDGEVALTKGYGVADRETGERVDAGTAFRIGSVSKTVLWTALMRQIRRGDLEPDAGVQEYVDVDLGDGEPITPANLATHTAGFEASNRGLWVPDGDVGPLSEYLRMGRARVRPPGVAAAYSNYGAALAGAVLADVRGKPFYDAIQNELLGPAGMTTSSFRQPLPDRIAERHASGHTSQRIYGPEELPGVGLAPAGSMSSTATDMARFLQLHCNDGVVDGTRVVDSGTLDALHRQWFTHHEGLPGMTFGFVERPRGDERVLWHNGSTLSFHSDLLVLPDRGLGLFVAFNGEGGTAARPEVRQGFLEEFVPLSRADAAGRPPDGTPARADELPGSYRSLRRVWTKHDRITNVVNAPTLEVTVAEDGALLVDDGRESSRWVEVEPLLFERLDGSGDRLAFVERDGAIQYLALGQNPATAFGRVGTLESRTLQGAFALVTLVGMLSGVVGWPLAGAVGWIRADGGEKPAIDPRVWARRATGQAKLVAGGGAVATLSFVVLALLHFLVTPLAVLSVPPVTFQVLFGLSLAGALGGLAAVGFAGRAWSAGDWSPVGRVHYSLVAGSLVGLALFLWYWNLVIPPF